MGLQMLVLWQEFKLRDVGRGWREGTGVGVTLQINRQV